jgi:hypothetical protein
MAGRVWREFHLSDSSMHRLEAILRHQHLPAGAVYRFEPGPDVLVTNLGMDILRRFARLDDIRLPDYVRLPPDDEIVQEVLEEQGR